MDIAQHCDSFKADHPTQSGTSQTPCGNAVDIVRKIGSLPINPTAKLVAITMRTTRVTDTKTLADMLGLSMRVVQRSKNEFADTGDIGDTYVATSANPATPTSLSPVPRVHARAQMESPSEIDTPGRLVEDSPLSPQFNIDEETCERFHEICVTWGRQPGAIEFGIPTIEDTNKQLAGEIKAVAIQHPEAEPRVLHAALLAALNTTSAKSKEPQEGQFKGRGRGSASSYLRKVYSSEVVRIIRDAANAEASRRADHQVHSSGLERRLSGTPARSSRPNLATMEFPA